MSRLVYSVTLPELPELDIVTQRITVLANGETETVDLPTDVVSIPDAFTVEEGAEVTVSLSYVDNVGNVGQPNVLTFTAVDTIAPPVPGVFSVTAVREEFPVAPETPVDPVDPEVPVEPQE